MGNQDKPSSEVLGILLPLLGFGVLFVAYHITNPPPPETPKTAVQLKFEQERAAAREQAQAESAKAQAESQARHAELCRWVALCKKYGEARQACAVAGDFQNCLEVKMGEVASILNQDCHNDGTLINDQNDTPASWKCIDVSIEDTLHIGN